MDDHSLHNAEMYLIFCHFIQNIFRIFGNETKEIELEETSKKLYFSSEILFSIATFVWPARQTNVSLNMAQMQKNELLSCSVPIFFIVF